MSLEGLEHLYRILADRSFCSTKEAWILLTSSSILASAISCSLPLPLAIFWASAIWFLTACVENRSLVRISEYRSTFGTYVGAEVLKRETLNSVDAQLGVGLDNGESTGDCSSTGYACQHCSILHWCSRIDQSWLAARCQPGLSDVRKNFLVAPPSSTTSTRPGLSCSIEGTWLARTPISPDSAGMLTWTLNGKDRKYGCE